MWWHNPFKHLAIFFLFPSMKFQPISFKIQLLKTSPQNRRTKTKAATCLFFWCLFPSCTLWILCNLPLLLTFCQVCLLVKETAEIETGMAEKSRLDKANIRQKLGLLWKNTLQRRLAKLSKTTFTYRSFS